MGSGDADDGQPTVAHLRERPLRAYLGGDEELFHVLTNRRTGVERRADDGERILPADDCGAVAGLTDRRVLLLVGDPEGHDGDFVASLPYTDLTDAEAVTETLTASLRFETVAGTTWSFTAREADVDGVASFLATACESWGAVTTALDDLEGHCNALATHLDAADWAAFDDRLSDAETALATAREGAEDAPVDGVVDRTERLATDLRRLVRDRHVRRGGELLSAAERLLAEDDYEASLDRVRTARARFGDATDVAARHGLGDGQAQAGLATADDLESTIRSRPLAAAREAHESATEADAADARVEALEEALDAYRAVVPLVTDPDLPFEGERATVREETEAVIADLIDARHARARDRRGAGNWEWQADNDEAAYELLSGAREDFERAIELAEQFPPGDADAIAADREGLSERLDPLEVRYELVQADEQVRD